MGAQIDVRRRVIADLTLAWVSSTIKQTLKLVNWSWSRLFVRLVEWWAYKACEIQKLILNYKRPKNQGLIQKDSACLFRHGASVPCLKKYQHKVAVRSLLVSYATFVAGQCILVLIRVLWHCVHMRTEWIKCTHRQQNADTIVSLLM